MGFHFGRLTFWSSSILVFFNFGLLPFWSKSDTFLYPCLATFVGCCFNLELLLTTLPHSSTDLSSRTAQRSYAPAQLNSPILPHSSTVLSSRTTQRSYSPAQLNGPTLQHSSTVLPSC